jgi:hypothetical protein
MAAKTERLLGGSQSRPWAILPKELPKGGVTPEIIGARKPKKRPFRLQTSARFVRPIKASQLSNSVASLPRRR